MTEAELLRHIRLGEDSALEFKAVSVDQGRVSSPDQRDLADGLSAFANSRGGTVLLGIEDGTRRILGIPLNELDAVETWVRDLCNDSIHPALDTHILKLELADEKDEFVPLLRIDVERSLHVHEGPHGYFRRIGSSKRKVPPEALARLFQERSQSRVIRFDESPVPDTTRGDLSYALTQRFLHRDAAEPASGGETPDAAAAEGAGEGSDGRTGGRTAVKDNQNRGNHSRGSAPVADNTETAPVPLEGIPSAIAVHLT